VKKSRFTEEQTAFALKQAELGTKPHRGQKVRRFLDETGFETDFGGGLPSGQSGAHSKKPRVVRGRPCG